MSYLLLFVASFLSATVVPFYSEIVLLAQVKEGLPYAVLWLVATFGNTLGAGVNWALGRWALHWQERRWFPVTKSQLERGQNWFQRFGVWSLLLAWLPVGGDALTLLAGVMRVRFSVFFVLTFIGKGLRYAVVVGSALILFAGVDGASG